MTREQLEHILRAAAAITRADRFVVIGSQSILGSRPDAPAELTQSEEVDVFTFRSAEDADLIDGSIGEGSPFHTTFGYYAHGVGEGTATLPPGWKERLVEVQSPSTGGAIGLRLEPHDLAVAKLVAGRDKDVEYVHALLRHRIVRETEVRARLGATQMDPRVREQAEARLTRAARP